MAFLLIFKADQSAFRESEAFEKLVSVGVRELVRNSMPGAAIAGHFHWCGDTVLVELKSDLQTFAISDYSPAAFEFALRLQAEFNDQLRVVDEAYSFDLELTAFETTDQLRDAIKSSNM